MEAPWSAPVVAVVAFALFAPPAHADIEQQPTTPREAPKAAPVMTKPPAMLIEVPPIYPDAAKAEHRTGSATVLVTIDATGHVAEVALKTSSGSPDLDAAALDAARRDVFTPAEIDGVAAAVAVELTMNFTLDEERVEVPIDAPATADLVPAAAPETVAPPVGPIAVDGVVRAQVSKLPLADVEITLPVSEGDTRTAITDEAGRFQFHDVAPGRYRLTLAFSGYETSFVDVDVVAKQRTNVIVALAPRDDNVFETVVREKRAKAEVTRVALTREELRGVAGTFGDPLRVIENLPGLARAPLAGGQLIVRGANPQDSSVLFDGIPIPNLYHFQGLKSVVNAEFLEGISFYPGGFPAKYGRATAGVVDVESRKLVPDALRGSFDVNLMDAGFFLTVPLDIVGLKDTTVAVAARRSYVDAYLPTILQIAAGPSGQAVVAEPIYWDYQAKLQHKLTDGQVSLFFFGSDDELRVETAGLGNNQNLSVGTHTGFHRVAGRWLWRADGVENVLQPFLGVSASATSAGDALNFSNGTTNWGLRDQLHFSPLAGVKLGAGVDYLGELNSIEGTVPLSVDLNAFPRVVQRTGTSSTIASDVVRHGLGLWVDAELEVFPGLLAVPGLRADIDRVSFADQVADDGTTTKGADVDLVSVDPRLALRFEVIKDWTVLKASGGLYHQTPTNLDLSPSAGNPDLKKPGAAQAIVGIEQSLFLDGLSLDLQGYITQRYDLVQGGTGGGAGGGGVPGGGPGGGGGPSTSNLTDQADNGGTGRTIGLEVLLRQQVSQYFYGWVAYTLSQTTVDTDKNSDEQQRSAFDQTHILTVVAQGKLPWGFGLGGRFRYVTGNPTTLPIGSFHDLDTGNYTQVFPTSSDTRQPDFVQLDVRIDKRFVFDSLALTTYVDVLNATNNANAEAVVSDYRGLNSQVITGLPIVPVFGVTGEF